MEIHLKNAFNVFILQLKGFEVNQKENSKYQKYILDILCVKFDVNALWISPAFQN